jgi:hypothetical protein
MGSARGKNRLNSVAQFGGVEREEFGDADQVDEILRSTVTRPPS